MLSFLSLLSPLGLLTEVVERLKQKMFGINGKNKKQKTETSKKL